MAFDYNKSVNQANTLKGYAEAINGYNRRDIVSVRSSLNDYWRNAMVPQIPELFNDIQTNLDSVYTELMSLYNDINTASKNIRDAENREIEAQRIAEEQKKKEEEAATKTAALQTSKTTKSTTNSSTKTTKTEKQNTTSNNKKDWWPFW